MAFLLLIPTNAYSHTGTQDQFPSLLQVSCLLINSKLLNHDAIFKNETIIIHGSHFDLYHHNTWPR